MFIIHKGWMSRRKLGRNRALTLRRVIEKWPSAVLRLSAFVHFCPRFVHVCPRLSALGKLGVLAFPGSAAPRHAMSVNFSLYLFPPIWSAGIYYRFGLPRSGFLSFPLSGLSRSVRSPSGASPREPPPKGQSVGGVGDAPARRVARDRM